MSDAVMTEMENRAQTTDSKTDDVVLGRLADQPFTGRGVFTVQTVDIGIAGSGQSRLTTADC